MKILRDSEVRGKRRVLIELDDDESFIAISNGHYKLGYPSEDVINDSELRDARRVTWCSIEQRWVD